MAKPSFEVFVVREGQDGGKGFWTKVGAAWPTKNGGYTIQLDALPLTGKLVLQAPRERDEPRTPANNSDDIPNF